MAEKPTINQTEFENFLGWLDTDREIAGQKYETIRLRLIKIFYARGCYTAEELADKSIDRVIKKCDELIKTYRGDPALYCYGVAKKVLLEYKRAPKTEELPKIISYIETDIEETEQEHECLTECLNKLPPEQRKIITAYFQGEKQAKIKERKKLLEELGITNESLRIRIFRTKNILRECIIKCVEQKSE